MSTEWNDRQPIYRQLRDRVAALIMDGTFAEGEPIPSVRTVAAESKINHLTVAKAYQALVNEGVLEMRRGLGMFVLGGAKQELSRQEREKFIEQELPELLSRAANLEISIDQIIELIKPEK